jgi:branched-chain amino acid transport system permease protein
MKKNRVFNTLTLFIVSSVLFILLLALLYTGIINEYMGGILIFAGINVIISLSLNLITGFTGQLSLGQAGFMAVGAYSCAIAIMRLHMPLFFAILFGGLVTAVFGLIIGIPTLRLKGDYLAITTLGFSLIIVNIMINLEGLTGGAAGLKDIPHLFDSDDFIKNMMVSFAWVYLFVIVTIVIISNLIKSSPGRAIVSIREDEIASNSMGINVAYYKIFSFTISAFLAGMGGALYGSYIGYLKPTMFGFMSSVNFVVYLVFGGLGSITGTILSAVSLTFLLELLRALGDFRLAIFGLLLIIMMIFLPRGIMGSKEFSIVDFTRKLLTGEYTPKKIAASMKIHSNGKQNKDREVK